jgi:hypothetical protein
LVVPLTADEAARFWRGFRAFRDLAVIALMLFDGLRSQEVLAIHNYLRLERPLTNSPGLFVSLQGPHRGQSMTPAGLRSLFRHHRRQTRVLRAGISLPAPTAMSPLPSLAQVFQAQLETLATVLLPATIRYYRSAVNRFLRFLGAAYPEMRTAAQLRRDPHMAGWLRSLGQEIPPLSSRTRGPRGSSSARTFRPATSICPNRCRRKPTGCSMSNCAAPTTSAPRTGRFTFLWASSTPNAGSR